MGAVDPLQRMTIKPKTPTQITAAMADANTIMAIL
jgi:hypothetical protein